MTRLLSGLVLLAFVAGCGADGAPTPPPEKDPTEASASGPFGFLN